jgi:intracellular septation protein A
MTMTDQTTPTTTAKPFRFAMLIPTLMVDVGAPIAIFMTLKHFGVPPIWALAGAALAPALNNLRIWIKSRRVEPLGIMVVGFGVVGTVASLVSGDLFYSLIKDSFLTGAFGAAFLASLFFGRPLVFHIIRPFIAGDDEARNQVWKDLWRYAAFRSVMRRLTIIWALVYIAEALVRVPLAMTLSPDAVVTISPIMGLGATLLLVFLTRRRMQAVRERLELFDHLKWPL